MPYQGPGIYRHYKGGLYEVLGLGLKEDTVVKEDNPDAGPEVVCVVYRPLSTPSFLDDRKEAFWLRELGVFDQSVPVFDNDKFNGSAHRFLRVNCANCGSEDDLTPVGGGMLVCGVCGSNTSVTVVSPA